MLALWCREGTPGHGSRSSHRRGQEENLEMTLIAGAEEVE
jgi:hypothetical protein